METSTSHQCDCSKSLGVHRNNCNLYFNDDRRKSIDSELEVDFEQKRIETENLNHQLEIERDVIKFDSADDKHSDDCFIFEDDKNSIDEKSNTVECNLCKELFENDILFKTHLDKHKYNLIKTNTISYEYTKNIDLKCDICLKVFKNKSILLRHIPSHNEIADIQCKTCKQTFKSQISLCSHPCEEANYICDQCETVFKSKQHLTCHIISKHINKIIYKCEFCSISFDSKLNLNRHSTLHKKFKCNVCNKMFKLKNYLKRHMHLHREPKPERNSKSRLSINNYMREHKKDFKCILCIESFDTKRNLNFHILISHKENAENDYKFIALRFICDYCNNIFNNKTHLRTHITKIHRKLYKYSNRGKIKYKSKKY